MELLNKDKRDGYVYDPIIKQYDTTFWKTTTGAPAMSGSVLRFTSAGVASYLQHIFADVEFSLNVPTTPSAGEAKQWGLRNPSGDNLGAAYFEITGAVFQVVTVDDGGTSQTTAVVWSAYEAAATEYRILWDPDRVVFYVNGTIVATHTTRVPSNALSLRILNSDADNTDLSYVAIRRAASII